MLAKDLLMFVFRLRAKLSFAIMLILLLAYAIEAATALMNSTWTSPVRK